MATARRGITQTPGPGCGMTFEEGKALVDHYVKYYWFRGHYYSLMKNLEMEDMISEVMMRSIRHQVFEKYNPTITSKKYYISNIVRTIFITLLRMQRQDTVSLEAPDEYGVPLEERVPDKVASLEDEVLSQFAIAVIIAKLPASASPHYADSPLIGYCNLGIKSVFLHLRDGWTISEISQLFQVSVVRVSQLRKKLLAKLVILMEEDRRSYQAS